MDLVRAVKLVLPFISWLSICRRQGTRHGARAEQRSPTWPLGPRCMRLIAPTVQDELMGARRALAASKAHMQGARMIKEGGYPVATILAQLEKRLGVLEPGRGVSAEAWFGELPVPEAQVALFLALLELAGCRKSCSPSGSASALRC